MDWFYASSLRLAPLVKGIAFRLFNEEATTGGHQPPPINNMLPREGDVKSTKGPAGYVKNLRASWAYGRSKTVAAMKYIRAATVKVCERFEEPFSTRNLLNRLRGDKKAFFTDPSGSGQNLKNRDR
jgi:hypothetical protein